MKKYYNKKALNFKKYYSKCQFSANFVDNQKAQTTNFSTHLCNNKKYEVHEYSSDNNDVFNKKEMSGQGTLEYLVIIGIIIVIGLITVSMSTNFLDSGSQINNTTANIKSTLGQGGISIVEAVTDSDGDTLLTLKNNTSEKIILTSITPLDASGNAGTKENYNTTIHYADTITFSYPTNTNCTCSENETTKTCNYEIEITSAQGLTKKETIQININCVDDSETIRPPITPIVTDCFNLAENPTQICTLTDLNRMREDLDGNYILMNNIDASETLTWNDGAGWDPIADYTTYSLFTGSLNGNGHIITNLYIYRPLKSRIGLFGALREANITNITLTDINFSGDSFVGGLVGTIYGNPLISTITNVTISGEITGNTIVGELIGGITVNSVTCDSIITNITTYCNSTCNNINCGLVTSVIGEQFAPVG